MITYHSCCELLSEFSTFGISNNVVVEKTVVRRVVNCFQNLVPLVSATTFNLVPTRNNCCELLSEFSTFGISNNAIVCDLAGFRVVNCFQNLVPLVSATTTTVFRCFCWCCELLSEFSTFGISNNSAYLNIESSVVVNCFQNLVPLVSATTQSSQRAQSPQL